MTHRLSILARPEVASGFALAGLRPLEASSDREGLETLRRLVAAPEVGVVLIEEGLYDRLGDDVRRRLARRPLPMVVPFPGPRWQREGAAAEAYIVELLRQVIGYRVRLT
jgi:vacuolar-type H+-ATPase subunit F/Vma7